MGFMNKLMAELSKKDLMKKETGKHDNLKAAFLSIFTMTAFTMRQGMVTDETVAEIFPNAGRLSGMLLKLFCAIEIEDYSIAGILAVFFCFIV